MQPDTIINLVAGGALAAFLAKLLQGQYEARIADFKDRIKEQSGLLGEMTKGFDAIAAKLESAERQIASLRSDRPAPEPGKGD